MAAAAVLLPCSACSAGKEPLRPESISSADPSAEKAFRAARDVFDRGDTEVSDRAFAAFMKAFPSDPLVKLAALYRARVAIARGEPSRARELLAPLLGIEGSLGERAAFYDGVALAGLAQHKEAVLRLEPFVGRMTDPAEGLLLLDTLWRSAREAGLERQAVLRLDGYVAACPPGEARENARKELANLVDEAGDRKALEDLAGALDRGGAGWPLVVARLAALHYEAGELDAAAKLLAEARAAGQGEDPGIARMWDLVGDRSDVDLGAVGCLVSLSGRTRLVGETVVRGVMLGAKDEGAGPEVNVVIKDVRDDPSLAARAVEELVLQDHVVAVIGPVDAVSAEIAATRAEELGVPLLALSAKEDLPAGRSRVFREFVTNRAEVRSLAAAMASSGARTVAVLYPSDAYGRTMRRLMSEETATKGLSTAVEVSYDPATTDFTDAAQTLSKIAFDALFVADEDGRIALVAPALASAGLWSVARDGAAPGQGRAIRFFAPSSAVNPDLIRRAGRYLQGASFAASFSEAGSPAAASFAAKFRAEYRSEPSYPAAFGHDAALLVRHALRSGARTRGAVADWLARLSGQANPKVATRFAGFDGRHEPVALPWILVVNGTSLEVGR